MQLIHFTDINEPRPGNSLLSEQYLPGFPFSSLMTFSSPFRPVLKAALGWDTTTFLCYLEQFGVKKANSKLIATTAVM